MQQNGCFTIDVSVQNGGIPLLVKDRKSILRLSHSKWWSLFYPPMMQADPFLFVHKDTLFLFYEYMPIGKGLGVIKVMSTNDMKHWTNPVQITHEQETHFSYPWVFEDEGQIYMLPETGCDHNLRLYKPKNDNLTEWEPYKVILERPQEQWDGIKFDYADSCIHKKDSVYYLFTSYYNGEQYFLELYISDTLTGPYVLHPSSPIATGNKYGRCAGSLIEADGKLYRPAQDCVTKYGGQTHVLEIDVITPNTYREHVLMDNILPTDEPLYTEGGHQINFVKFKGQTVVATDAGYSTSFILERMRIKMLKLLGLKENNPY